ncbi:acyltransferase family protein [Clostridium fungisolvens]|uniref:Acyltransferase 3 domain-containing protein n=1 Tax=Clostridium fungisolvens TaxID=1604897 RepID=A0A6V8SAG6_9CLOT|nr:acyltransferase [Clostridium fungisolvens]GFP74247.1 hypothetical protein bsdtw1_00292 [Clostridium fungisolvens]
MNDLIKRVFRINNSNISELDAMRGIAVLLVFFYHIMGVAGIRTLSIRKFNVAPFMMWGHLGVDIFYILSGFLLFLPFGKAYYNNTSVNLKDYFIKRALRILPAFYFFIIIYVFCVNTDLLTKSGFKSILGNMMFLQNYPVFNIKVFNDTTWTLAVEVQFYIILPIIAKFFTGNKAKKSFIISIIIVMIYRLAVTAIIKPTMVVSDTRYYMACEANILGCFDNFAIGMLISNLYIKNSLNITEIKISKIINVCKKLSLVSPLVFTFLMYNYYNSSFNSSMFHNIFFSFFFDITLYLFVASIIVVALFSEGKLINSVLNNRILIFMGTISYSIYIWHLFFQQRLNNIPFIISSTSLQTKYIKLFLVSVIFIIPFSALMYLLVERPFIDLSKKLFSRKKEGSKNDNEYLSC